ncbi:MAG: N-acetylmuramoyl-L-alanine amidase [Bacteroidota bacterium]|nr:N-acetylmuramoyl-L-alanine amidase [Bacteroidota bacterium]
MITLAWYLSKVLICSGILCGYYYVALRNKVFHRWNRFYLLASIVLAMIIPIVKINIFQSPNEKGTVVKMLQTINNSDEIIIEYGRYNGLQLSSTTILFTAYTLVTIIFFSIFILGLYKIKRLRRKNPVTQFEGINFIATDAKGTPFSFFNSIFWNNAIDLHSPQGQQIFNHEIAHVKEKHSYDKMLANVVLIFFWMNPFFWMMKKELSMIHEFIADEEALKDSDINAFAEMILQTVYPGQNFSLTNNFFHSPLKRRLLMFTKNKNLRVSYVSRLLVLPLMAFIFFAFTIKMNTASKAFYNGKQITVVIDASHGGTDNGVDANGVTEKDLSLAIAKEIKALNHNPNLVILLSRDKDEVMSVKDRTAFATEKKADLFVSIHMDKQENNTGSGLKIFIPKNDFAYLKQSQLLGSAIIESFQNNYQLPVAKDLQQRKEGVWVLKENQCPSVLIEAGFLSAQQDVEFLKNVKNQQIVAENILKGIENYAAQNLTDQNTIDISGAHKNQDTSNSAKVFARLEGNAIIEDRLTQVRGKADTAFISNFSNDSSDINVHVTANAIKLNESKSAFDPIYIINGKEISKSEMATITPISIHSINVLKGETAANKYGAEGKNGVVEIFLKTPGSFQIDTLPDKVFTKVENEASFPGGQEAWIKYIVSKIQAAQESFTNKDFGTCVLKFIVNTDGTISNVEATTMKKTKLAEVAINAIRTGPKWMPATQNGQTVAAYRLQPVTLSNPDTK